MKKFNVGDKVCIRRKIPFTGIVGTITYLNYEDEKPYAFVSHGKKYEVGYYIKDLMSCCSTLKDGQLVLVGEVPRNLISLACEH